MKKTRRQMQIMSGLFRIARRAAVLYEERERIREHGDRPEDVARWTAESEADRVRNGEFFAKYGAEIDRMQGSDVASVMESGMTAARGR